MSETLIGLLHPGEMGAAVAGCLTGRGYQVLWVPAGRSPATAARAAAAGLTAAAGPDAAGQAADLARRADIILSICPPHAALPVARAVAGRGAGAFTGIFVDANAVSPGTAREVAAAIESAGARYVDGGIIGSPPGPAGGTRLYLSGPHAGPVAALFAGTALEPRVIEGARADRGVRGEDGLRRLDQGHRRADPRGARAGPGRGGGGHSAGRVGAVPAGPGRAVRGRGPVSGWQRLALDRGDGGDQREHARPTACPVASIRPRRTCSAILTGFSPSFTRRPGGPPPSARYLRGRPR